MLPVSQMHIKKTGPTSKNPSRAGPATKRQPHIVRERILAAARVHFTRDGFKGARMRWIAAEAGVTSQLLVHHFKSKEGLWRTLMIEFFTEYDALEERHRESYSEGTAVERLRIEIKAAIRLLLKFPDTHKMFTQEAGQPSSRLQWLIENYVSKHFELICNLLRQGQAGGFVRPGDPVTLYTMILAMLNAPCAFSALHHTLDDSDPFSADVIEQIEQIINDVIFVSRCD